MSQIQGILNSKNHRSNCEFYTYACLQQPETLQFLKYLKLSDQSDGVCLNFNSDGDDASRNTKKNKKFTFDGYYNRKQKLKYQFSKTIKQIAQNALKGENQTLFVYGTQEKCKDKIIFGQSQNPGLFLCILSQIFQQCHHKAIQDEVTIKFSCSLFNKGKFLDILGGNRELEVQFSEDLIQGGIFHNVPEIIIRNVKTGLKLLNIMLKHVYDLREQQFTQNLITTLKLELDCKKNEEQTQIYCISKINFIKLANPSVNSSLKGINKNNIWFVNFVNFIQERSISGSIHEEDGYKAEGTLDQFTEYLRQSCFRSSHKIFGFVSISNQMSSNQCLTALLFSNHLKNCKTSSNIYLLDTIELAYQRHHSLETILAEVKNSFKLISYWLQYVGLLADYMNQLNLLQFQYSLVIGEACERLNKYIFTEELEDFFYAKKTSVEPSEDLYQTYANVRNYKLRLFAIRKKISQEIYSKIDEKTLQKFFNLQFSLAHHFLIEDLTKLQKRLSDLAESSQLKQPKKAQQVFPKTNKQISQKNTEFIQKEKKQDKCLSSIDKEKIRQKYAKQVTLTKPIQKQNNQNSPHNRLPKKVSSPSFDNLECMFRNKNVGNTKKRDISIF